MAFPGIWMTESEQLLYRVVPKADVDPPLIAVKYLIYNNNYYYLIISHPQRYPQQSSG